MDGKAGEIQTGNKEKLCHDGVGQALEEENLISTLKSDRAYIFSLLLLMVFLESQMLDEENKAVF